MIKRAGERKCNDRMFSLALLSFSLSLSLSSHCIIIRIHRKIAVSRPFLCVEVILQWSKHTFSLSLSLTNTYFTTNLDAFIWKVRKRKRERERERERAVRACMYVHVIIRTRARVTRFTLTFTLFFSTMNEWMSGKYVRVKISNWLFRISATNHHHCVVVALARAVMHL